MPDHTTKAVPAAMSVEKNVRIPMRDGIHLASDIYRPPAPGKVPALLAIVIIWQVLQRLAAGGRAVSIDSA